TGTVAASGDTDGDVTFTAGTFSTAHGSVTILANGSFTYTPTTGYVGSDSFGFTANDEGSSSNGTETVNVVAPPVITVPGAQVLKNGTAATISGVSVSESGNFAG